MERCFSKLNQFRAVTTRYDKRERIYKGTIDVASIKINARVGTVRFEKIRKEKSAP